MVANGRGRKPWLLGFSEGFLVHLRSCRLAEQRPDQIAGRDEVDSQLALDQTLALGTSSNLKEQ